MKTDIGSTVRTLRKAAGMTQMQLADKVGVSYQQIQKYEKGKSTMSINRAIQIADIFRVPVAAFLGEKNLDTEPVKTSNINENEALVLTIYRRINNERLSQSVMKMAEDLVRVIELRLSTRG